MNTFIKNRIFHNLWLKVLSFVLAILAWCMIMNASDPSITTTIKNITVNQTNTDAVTVENKIFDVVKGNSLSVTVTGPRSEVQNLTAQNFNAYVDLRELSLTNACPIHIDFKNKDAYKNSQIVSKSDEVMVFSLEDMVSESKQVTCVLTGSTFAGYYAVATVNPVMLEVYGSKNNVDNVEKLVAYVDVSDKVESFSSKANVIAVDAKGSQIDSNSVDIKSSSVTVDVDILRTKNINVTVDYNIEAEYGFAVTNFEQAPKSVVIAGPSGILNITSEIKIPYNAKGVKENISDNIDIKDYLPTGCHLVSDIDAVTISATIERLSESREMSGYVRNLDIRDLNDQFDLEENPSNDFKIKVWGAKDSTAALSVSDLKLYVDASNIKRAGTYTLKLMSDNSAIMIDECEVTVEIVEKVKKVADEV